MSGIIVPNSALEAARELGYVSAEDEKPLLFTCAVPGCGLQFPVNQRQQFDRHTAACAKRNMDRIQEAVARVRAEPLASVEDREAFEWHRGRAAERGRAEPVKGWTVS